MTVFLIIQAYFGLGALLFARVTSRRGSKAGWIKFFTYLLIVNFVVLLISLGGWYFRVFAICMLLVGFFELWLASAGMKSWRLRSRIIFIAIGLGFMAFARLPQNLILYTYLGVFLFDGFSQLCGQLLGHTKLAPRISPNKTWEGTAGGTLFTLLSLYFLRYMASLEILPSLLLAAVICLSSLAGDLLASALKRQAGLKDYGNLIPGHGGILDRFDSFIFCGAVMALVHVLANV